MQQPVVRWFFLLLITGTTSCKTLFHKHTAAVTSKDDGKLEAVFVQVNDVYEIAPISNGRTGGMARVATLKKEYKQNNPNTFLVLAGDFLSPSVYNSLKFQDKQIRGRQMVDVMNAAGMDFVTFGNHEFDIKEKELQERLNESQFLWISSNCFHKQNGVVVPFGKQTATGFIPFPKTYILSLKDADGTTAKIGFIGLTLPFNKADYVGYIETLSTAKAYFEQLKESCDAVVAITHQSMEDDIKLATEVPGLAAILGGHEHDMRFEKLGNLTITKAHANARSAYIVKIFFDKKKKTVSVTTTLKELNESVKLDSSTNVVVKKWIDIADGSYLSLGFDPKKIILKGGEPLDGRESEVRSRSTALTRLVVEAMAAACPQADVALLNSGSIRVDDVLYPPLSEYDILRSMPFGGTIKEVEMKGRLLSRILETGRKNAGTGGFLQYNKAAFNNLTNIWTLKNAAINPEKTYHVALVDFLLSGKESNLGFLNPQNPDITKVYEAVTAVTDPRSDIRLAVIQYLQKTN